MCSSSMILPYGYTIETRHLQENLELQNHIARLFSSKQLKHICVSILSSIQDKIKRRMTMNHGDNAS